MSTITNKKRPLIFTLMGIINTLVDYGVYTTLALLVFRDDSKLVIASIISGSVATICAYFLHRYITWKDKKASIFTIIKFFIANIFVTFLIRPIISAIFIRFTGLYDLAFDISSALHLPFSHEFVTSTGVFGLMTIIILIANYFAYSRFVFNDKLTTKWFRSRLARLLDQIKLSLDGIHLVFTTHKSYFIIVVIFTILFGTLLTITSSGTTDINLLLSSLPFLDKLQILARIIADLFTKNLLTPNGLLIILISLIQSLAISLLIYNHRHRQKIDSALSGSIFATLAAFLGTGCASCGTSLIVPIINLLFSSSVYAIASIVGVVFMFFALLLSLYTTYRLGYLAYITHTANHKRSKK